MIRLKCRVREVEKESSFKRATNHGDFESDSLVIATGGLSIPKIGATDFGYRVARQFGLRIRETRPALVPLTFASQTLDELKTLSGISIDALAACNGAEFRENILLTHRGLSGPAILQVSSHWRRGDAVSINLLPEHDAALIFASERRSQMELSNLLSRAIFKDDGSAPRTRPLLHRRSHGRDGPTRRLQLPMGVGLRLCRRTIRVISDG